MKDASEPGKPGAWVLAARPKTLPVAVVPVVVGSAMAFAETSMFSVSIVVVAMFCALLIQIGTNLHNDVADFERGADDPATRLGPRRATAEGWLQPRAVNLAAAISFAAAFFIGLYLVAIGGWPILLLGVTAIAAGYAYSGGPRPIAYTCFGEVFVLAFFGLAAVGGTYYLQASGRLTGAALLAGIAVGLPAAAVLVVNNTRDLDADRRAGRRTFPVMFGKTASHIQYSGFLLASILLASATAWQAGAGAWAAGCLLMFPWAYHLGRCFREASAPGVFNQLLAATARFGLCLGAVLSLLLVVTSR